MRSSAIIVPFVESRSSISKPGGPLMIRAWCVDTEPSESETSTSVARPMMIVLWWRANTFPGCSPASCTRYASASPDGTARSSSASSAPSR